MTIPPDTTVSRWAHGFDALVDDAAGSGVQARPAPDANVVVYRNLADPPEPFETGGLPGVAQVVLFGSSSRTYERLAGGRPHYDGTLLRPGQMTVAPPELCAESCLTTWRATSPGVGSSFTSVMISEPLLARAAAGAERDYASLEFRTGYGVRDALARELIAALAREAQAGSPGGRLYGEQLLAMLAAHLVRAHTVEAPTASGPRGGLPARALARVREYVAAHLAGDLSLRELAAVAGYSDYHFARAFKTSTGQTPAAYARRLRLARAADLLRRETDWTVAQVGLACGYANATAFAAAFGRVYGLAPTQYRRAG